MRLAVVSSRPKNQAQLIKNVVLEVLFLSGKEENFSKVEKLKSLTIVSIF